MKAAGKAKRPVLAARIKRIMQSDEDVGKISQATPVVMSKALELFLQDLADDAVGAAHKRGSRTINASFLKEAIMSNPNFDFMKDVVAAAPDPPPATNFEPRVQEAGGSGVHEGEQEAGASAADPDFVPSG
eukprot:CAMPEP_0118948498 /NCGR_PEP_ID=MMETSP1169-20130426/47942_1 /TAXON_ID=36882 /ORGANISM="Pyramimonas obovata, Strain CCMP722" /LENGTH=130 /DNA_ID=CAMNT_0006894943 /DNA_START=430 /DNA_END=819 /DNA_ORIENTATION=-